MAMYSFLVLFHRCFLSHREDTIMYSNGSDGLVCALHRFQTVSHGVCVVRCVHRRAIIDQRDQDSATHWQGGLHVAMMLYAPTTCSPVQQRTGNCKSTIVLRTEHAFDGVALR